MRNYIMKVANTGFSLSRTSGTGLQGYTLNLVRFYGEGRQKMFRHPDYYGRVFSTNEEADQFLLDHGYITYHYPTNRCETCGEMYRSMYLHWKDQCGQGRIGHTMMSNLQKLFGDCSILMECLTPEEMYDEWLDYLVEWYNEATIAGILHKTHSELFTIWVWNWCRADDLPGLKKRVKRWLHKNHFPPPQ